ncbi:sirohydrochlorin cobaltochelatase [Desulfoluna butyratoxydans]|uniref:Anaerobic cobalt chelatase n=1 Tax=Desulfoluna butyratoxydans TaxID=231438 RepID=A0A4U8YR72_9BACT|nr:sirohydrochlorin cobaltochelatase [Desulfoluna butyratoxydans]VFQ46786.1 anaerobic cobalt chelatase [Desulfoluna butyratoxydans]
MKPVIVPVAFGTTSKALETYTVIDEAIKHRFPEHEVRWAWSSRMVRDAMKKKGRHFPHPHEVLAELADEGKEWAVMQSMHLICGHEFTRLLEEVHTGKPRISVGLPLITSPEDCRCVVDALGHLVSDRKDEATLFIGHGTDHPAWTTYFALDAMLKNAYGPSAFTGVVEGFPEAEDIVDTVKAAGFTRVKIVPLMLVAGVHYLEDLTGDDEDSWKNLFAAEGIESSFIDRGIGYMPEIVRLFVRHLEEAMDMVLESEAV